MIETKHRNKIQAAPLGRLCKEYEEIAHRSLSLPQDTAQLMELSAFVQKTESATIYEMEQKLDKSKDRLVFLMDYAQFSPTDMRLNSKVFDWHNRMADIFEEHKINMREKREQFEENLRYKRERFIEELEGYSKQVIYVIFMYFNR